VPENTCGLHGGLTCAIEISTQTLRFYRQRSAADRCAIGEIVRSLLQLYSNRLVQSKVAVRLEEKPAEPLVCYAGELRQVFANLITNAIDAMKSGGGILRVRVKPGTVWSTGLPGVRVTIADTGMGMDSLTKARMYEAFFTTKRATGRPRALGQRRDRRQAPWIDACAQPAGERHSLHRHLLWKHGDGNLIRRHSAAGLWAPFGGLPVRRYRN
jgi:hypothetical protein